MVVYREELPLVSLKDDAYFGYTGKEKVQKKIRNVIMIILVYEKNTF